MQTSSHVLAPGWRLPRSAESHVLTGVAGGLGERLGVEPAVIRAAFVTLSVAGGFGILVYVALWILSVPADAAAARCRRPLAPQRQVGGVASITVGSLLILRAAGVWLGDGIVWPVGLAAFGVSLIWVRGESPFPGGRNVRLAADTSVFSAAALIRLALGALLIFVGMGTVLAANMTFTLSTFLDVLLPVAITGAGLVLIFGPWVFRLAQEVSRERRQRIRSEERSEMAAHLHDSVLQTLALIQRAPSPREMSMLARVQERELRSWLYGKSATLAHESLHAAIDVAAARVEEAYHCNVETVVVGDAHLDEKLHAVVGACSEAMTNAARHSGDDSISVYVEAGDAEVAAYVRDHGKGFVPASVPGDRRGIADSIVGRMERNGGTATIETEPGEGTEVQLRMPR